jgi:hypothetical protein
MKRLGLIALPFLLATPAIAADLDGPRYSEREVIIERRPTIVERHYYQAPVIEYVDEDPVEYVEFPRVHGFTPPYPAYYGWFGHRHHHHRHWRRHHHHRHHR